MPQGRVLHTVLQSALPNMHKRRLDALIEVVDGLMNSSRLTITEIGRGIRNMVSPKHNIEKVDRLCANGHLVKELPQLYSIYARLLLSRLSKSLPIVIDVCYLKDHHELQTIRASIALNGRSLTVYELCFDKQGIKKAYKQFLSRLNEIIPDEQEVIVICDAGFKVVCYKEIEKLNWNWVGRARRNSGYFCFVDEKSWSTCESIFSRVNHKPKLLGEILFTKEHRHHCILIGYKRKLVGRYHKNYQGIRMQCRESRAYSKTYREPWLLATSLSIEKYSAKKVVNIYEKRMQIEESFRDLKSHQFGLGARYSGTKSVDRWNILLLIANLALFLFWLIGRYAHKEGLNKHYQSNTRYRRKEFSDVYLGRVLLRKLSVMEQIKLISKVWCEFKSTLRL